jgi:conjugative transfer signal peptidase TraF
VEIRDLNRLAGDPKSPRRAYLLTAAALVAGWLLKWFLCINLVSASMPRGFFLLLRSPGQPRPRLVLLCLPPELAELGRARGYLGLGTCPGGAAAVLKPVVAVGGDRVSIGPEGVRVNGVLLPRSAPLATDRAGRPLTVRWRGPAVLPPGSVLVVSTFTERSWDGRYWGPLPESLVQARAVPLLLEEPLPPLPSPTPASSSLRSSRSR